MGIETPIDPQTIGAALYFILTNKTPYNKYTDIYSTSSNSTANVVMYIQEVYSKHFGVKVDLTYQNFESILQPGDIFKIDSRPYVVTQTNGVQVPVTWPNLIDEDMKYLTGSDIRTFQVTRPNFSASATLTEKLETISKDVLNQESQTNKLLNAKNETFLNADQDKIYEYLGDGVLQIGDLIFMVDPTQIAFNTQNGYQYFPTIRTQGNPKIPTMNQVKNLSINLIFPNEDSINNQLLSLYAMYRRTPFVNIRNKDICAFFKEICYAEEWLGVALESIQIQSVEGFPNTLQASITILPFDWKTISNGFQALLSIEDVERQQAILYRDIELEELLRKSDSNLRQQNISTDRFLDIVAKDIKKSPDFRNSLPFRAFYQALIAERDSVVNNLGAPVPTNRAQSFSLARFRPSDPNNLLHEYRAESNQEAIELEYNYIPEDFRGISKKLSDQRLDKQNEILGQLNDLYGAIKKPEDVARQLVTLFASKEDYYNITEAKFNEISNNVIPNLMARYGITLTNQEGIAIKNLWDLTYKGIAAKVGIVGTWETVKDLNAIIDGRISPDTLDLPGFLNGVTYNDLETHGVGTFQWGIKQIGKWLDSGTEKEKENKKQKISAFLIDMRQTIQKELGIIDTEEMIIIDPMSGDSTFKVNKLPLQKAKVIIDNRKDIVTSWSIIFANKFIPINLQAFKYPYYQHIGSEDATISLAVTSVSDKPNDFKSNLSLLSERLYETVKTVTLTAPELITYLDSRLTVNVPDNHIFNSFGIRKVVFESSNSVNINQQPNAWNTTINFTQANLTIDKYHGISRIPASDMATNEVAKILACIEYDAAGNLIVVEYTSKNGTPLTLNDIMRIRFLEWSYKQEAEYNIIDYINSVLTQEKSGVGITGKAVGQKYLNELHNAVGNRSANFEATKVLQELLRKNPSYGKIIKFMNSRVDDLFKQKIETLKQVIYPSRGFFGNFYNSLKTRSIGEPMIAVGISSLMLSLFLPVVVLVAGGIGTIAGVDAGQLRAKDKLIGSLNGVFMSMEDSFTSSIALDFASKVIRDPSVYKNLINEKTIGIDMFNNIERLKNISKVPCYNDFDIPAFGEGMIIGPDFYLYNAIIDGADMRTYINEASKRYAKIGKLTAMMTLTEATESLKKYDEILSRVKDVDPEIKKNIEVILTENITGDISDSKNIKGIINSLQGAQDILSLCTKSTDDVEEAKTHNSKILEDFVTNFKDKLKPPEFEASYKVLAAKVSRSNFGIGIEDMDFQKLNLIYTARMKTMLEIFDVYSILNTYMVENSKILLKQQFATNDQNSFTDKDNNTKLSKSNSEKISANDLYEMVVTILKNPKSLTQDTLKSGTWGNKEAAKLIKDTLKDKYENGLAEDFSPKYVSLPGIQNLQNFLFNKIGFYIRLNSFLLDKSQTTGSSGRIDLTTLPELKFLEFWNYRMVDENNRKIKIIKQFADNHDIKKDTTIKMFPTFKLFFVEEDKNFITHNFDDYYTHNAIQSIEVISNKNSPSTTAVIRLSNVTNSLTDKMSLMRESEELYGYSLTGQNTPNMFLGTLDIKPGTQVIIKMGYAPYDNLLTTIFQGRIIEMNNGPVVEMICQSYGAQLNHQIVQHKFGLFSTEKEHGDVASSILDMIPGLEKLGKPSMWGISNTEDFTGRNSKNITGKIGDRFLMSNLLGSLDSMMFGQDNPRDENLYLNYSAVQDIYHRATFDWVVYDQTVWDSLREISLYHRNKIVVVRPYNTNSVSSNNDLRETLVIGDKTGFYKATDAFGLSTLDFRGIDKVASEWKDLQSLIVTNQKLYETETTSQSLGMGFSSIIYKYTLNNNGKLVYSFLQDKLSALTLVAHLLKHHTNTNSGANIIELYASKLVDNKFIPNDFKELIYNLITFSKMSPIDENDLNTIDFGTLGHYSDRFKYFTAIITGLKKYLPNVELEAEEYYNVKVKLENNDDKYINDPQYKRIQKHHLITDVSDIITNNISLNSNFSNVVNLYYTGEPKIKTASIDRMDDDFIKKRLNVWTVKAFGDQRDEFSRPLNSYQKNVDTNWFDIVESEKNFFARARGADAVARYSKIKADDIKSPNWNAFPSFVVVGVSLLQREVEKMYQGTLEIVGNPNIQPFDIIHLQDYSNDMHGVVEVEEVIHTFTPDGGFRTVITPNLITFDRDPIQMQDVQVINQIYDFANSRRVINTYGGLVLGAGSLIGATAVGAGLGGATGGFVGMGLGLLAGASFAYNATVGTYTKYHKFMYDQMGHILGRDCINFTSLLYHGMPYITGFDGVDYTNLKTLMNHSVADIKNPITRYLAFGDTFLANITTGWDPSQYGFEKSILGRLPVADQVTGYGTTNLRGPI